MSLRAREFVESFIVEYERPAAHETDGFVKRKLLQPPATIPLPLREFRNPKLMRNMRIW
jgi:hypothetical protein